MPELPPAAPVAKERLTFIDPSLTPVYGRTLLQTGGDSVFCLVERALRLEGHSTVDGDECVLRVTTFRARYGKDGELVATPLRPGRSYLISRYVRSFNAPAFWI
jgi:hypothetical protein